MERFPWELVLAALVVSLVVGLYAIGVQFGGVPQPGGFVGHSLGVVGFLLMLAAETLYTLRKRIRGLTLGRMRTWLQAHVVCGIVGPAFVLLHSAGKLSGLAGALTLLTALMVLSGFMGRYIYTAAPRSLDGAEFDAQPLEEALADADRRLEPVTRREGLGELAREIPPAGWKSVLARGWLKLSYHRRVRAALGKYRANADVKELQQLLTRRYGLWLQVQALLATRRLLALWYLFHVPLGAVLFTLAFVHIAAALYYSTFLK